MKGEVDSIYDCGFGIGSMQRARVHTWVYVAHIYDVLSRWSMVKCWV
jgi:hypothetical protein